MSEIPNCKTCCHRLKTNEPVCLHPEVEWERGISLLPPDLSTPSWCPISPDPVEALNALGFKTLGQAAAEKGGKA